MPIRKNAIVFLQHSKLKARAFDTQAKTLPQNVAQKKYNELMQKSQILQQHLQQEEERLQLESQTQMDSLLSKVKKKH